MYFTTVIYAALSAIGIVILQAALTRGVARASSAAKRGVFLAIKFPIWAGFFAALASAGRDVFLAGSGVAIAGYLFVAARWMLHARGRR